jgi:hypothetical protein
MRILRAATAAVAATLTVSVIGLTAVPASAQQVRVTDEVGDASGGMDLTGVTFVNADRRVRFVVDVEEVRPGHLVAIVRTDRRHPRRLTYVSANWRRDDGTGRVRVLVEEGGEAQRVPCDGVKQHWDRVAGRVVFSAPSRCIGGGDYGAVRASMLSERPTGGDSDWAPDEGRGGLPWTAWIPRG